MTSALSDAEIYQLARGAGFDDSQAVTMTAIALAESGGNPGNVGDQNLAKYGSQGLWQIYTGAHPPTDFAKYGVAGSTWNALNVKQLDQPSINASAAMKVYSEGGFHSWTSYWSKDGGKTNSGNGNGAYAQYLPRAKAASKAAASGAPPAGSVEASFPTTTTVKTAAWYSPGNLLNDVTDPIGAATSGIASGFETAFKDIVTSDFVKRVGAGLAGGVLILIAMSKLAGDAGIPTPSAVPIPV